MYYNPKTKESVNFIELKDRLNASIPYDLEVVENGNDPDEHWYLVHNGEQPDYDPEHQVVEYDPTIRQVGDKYCTSYKIREMSEQELQRKLQQKKEIKLQQAKNERSMAVNEIRVVVDGMKFDGDEKAQDRMSRVAAIAGANEQETVLPWVLADNTVANVTVAQIKEALRKALYAQAALWVKPYTNDEEESESA